MRPMLATAHYATRKGLNRPFARVTARDRRMGHKISMGLTPKQVAQLEGMVPADVETLVAEPEFKALIDGYNTLHAMPEDEQRRILTQLARHLLMEARPSVTYGWPCSSCSRSAWARTRPGPWPTV
jgi:hypothetical protein